MTQQVQNQNPLFWELWGIPMHVDSFLADCHHDVVPEMQPQWHFHLGGRSGVACIANIMFFAGVLHICSWAFHDIQGNPVWHLVLLFF